MEKLNDKREYLINDKKIKNIFKPSVKQNALSFKKPEKQYIKFKYI
jgi:hypothetical protein